MDLIRSLCKDDTIFTTKHFLDRLEKREISYDDVLTVILNGEVIEDYPSAYPYPCILMLGCTNGNKPLHVVLGTDGTYLWLITTYYPTLDKWNNDFKTRREEK